MASSDYPTARPFLPDDTDLDSLASAARDCRGCPLYREATQVVFGTGPTDADLMIVGEQPGRKEDRSGQPFLGRAGQLLDRALELSGLRRSNIYVTNAVKHFKSKASDGHPVKATPKVGEIHACRPWLESEIAAVQPEVIVALGAVAARSLTGESVAVGGALGAWFQTAEGRPLVITYHPSAAIYTSQEANENHIVEIISRDLRRARDMIGGTRSEFQPRA